MNLASVILSSVLQVLVFTAIPFAVYLIGQRTAKGFPEHIGLTKPNRKAMLYATLFALVTLPLGLLARYYFPEVQELTSAQGTTAGRLEAVGFSFSSVVLVGFLSFVQTGLAEEIFFRGFIAKRLIAWLGFAWGNLIQALIFAAVHILLFVVLVFAVPGAPEASLLNVALVVLIPGLAGWVFGFLNERIGNGSIAPSWWAHGLTNAASYFIAILA